MFVSINFYFRPCDFVAVYQRVERIVFVSLLDLVYIGALNRVQK